MNLVDIEKELDETTLSNLEKAFDNPIRLQIFKTYFCDGYFDEAMKEHKREILTHIVHSKYDEVQFAMYDHKMYCMSGFKEQENRLPNKNDKIRIIRGRYYFEKRRDFILSEIGFEIVRGESI